MQAELITARFTNSLGILEKTVAPSLRGNHSQGKKPLRLSYRCSVRLECYSVEIVLIIVDRGPPFWMDLVTLSVAGPSPSSAPRSPEKLSPSRRLDRDGEGVIMKVVAGTRFEPMTFSLSSNTRLSFLDRLLLG